MNHPINATTSLKHFLTPLLLIFPVGLGCATFSKRTTEIRVKDRDQVSVAERTGSSTPLSVSSSAVIKVNSAWSPEWRSGDRLSVPVTFGLTGEHVPGTGNSIQTPWANVEQITERITPDRSGGAALLAVGVPFLVAGTVAASQPGASDRVSCFRGCSSQLGAGIAAAIIGAVLTIPGLATALAPTKEKVVFSKPAEAPSSQGGPSLSVNDLKIKSAGGAATSRQDYKKLGPAALNL